MGVEVLAERSHQEAPVLPANHRCSVHLVVQAAVVVVGLLALQLLTRVKVVDRVEAAAVQVVLVQILVVMAALAQQVITQQREVELMAVAAPSAEVIPVAAAVVRVALEEMQQPLAVLVVLGFLIR